MKTYERVYDFEGEDGWGFVFPCDINGDVGEDFLKFMTPQGKKNLEACLSGTVHGRKVIDKGVHEVIAPKRKLCDCGSGKECYDLLDARGIFCCFVCENCEGKKKAKYRSDIFDDTNYLANEPIEEGA